jgi:lipoprotein-anchoring transpeptidase ErfK/SrfK
MLADLRAVTAKLEPPSVATFRSRADSLDWERARAEAERAREYRIVVSLFDRKVVVLHGTDTIRVAKAAVASGMTLDYAGRKWTFRTPRGRHRVLRKADEPVWTPPDWLYAEVASEHELKLSRIPNGGSVRLSDGSRLSARDSVVGIMTPQSAEFVPLRTDEHIVFDNTIFIPPYGTVNRRISGELGRYALDLGEGYMIHGTPHEDSIGRAITHGCIRLADEDIAWMYEMIPVGTPVYIY